MDKTFNTIWINNIEKEIKNQQDDLLLNINKLKDEYNKAHTIKSDIEALIPIEKLKKYEEKNNQQQEQTFGLQLDDPMSNEKLKTLEIEKDIIDEKLTKLFSKIRQNEIIYNKMLICLKFLHSNSDDKNISIYKVKDTVRVLELLDNERQKIKKDIIDGPQKHIKNLISRVGLCKKLLQTNFTEGLREFSHIENNSKCISRELGQLMFELSPRDCNKGELETIIIDLIIKIFEGTDTFVDYHINIECLPYIYINQVCRITQELLRHIKKYTNADRIDFSLKAIDNKISVFIIYNGVYSYSESSSNKSMNEINAIKGKIYDLNGTIVITRNQQMENIIEINLPIGANANNEKYNNPQKAKVMICCTQDLICEGIQRILENDDTFKIDDIAKKGMEIKLKLRNSIPDIILIDISTFENNIIQTLAEIRKNYNTKIIMLISEAELDVLKKSLEFKADGYIFKDTASNGFADSIKQILNGKTFVDARIMNYLSNTATKTDNSVELNDIFDNLTVREIEILNKISLGLSNKEIANELYVSEKTVKNYTSKLFRKINVRDRTQAGLFAVKNEIQNYI